MNVSPALRSKLLRKGLQKIAKQHAKTAPKDPQAQCPACFEAKRRLAAKLEVSERFTF